MSLILEALRKSEAERRRAAVPDLLAEPQVATPTTMRAPQRWPWIAATGALALAVLWVALRDPSPAPLSVAPIAEAPPVSSDAPTPAQPSPTTPRTTPTRRPLVVAAPAPALAASAPPASAPAASAPAASAQVAATPTQTPPPVAGARDVPPPRVEPIAAAAPRPAPVVIDTTPRVTDLVGEERKQLPALKLSMHMWNDDAAQRFVIIDGARLRIGDHLGAVVVADILPDGVLLDWNGRPLKLPLR
ncbi:general secretion pathway protein GspB [Lysobacter sp. A6]|uniref:General secretion pathway protein GspB n=1 Tax=Noviluteimonas lactosilytica TaxID=2888523 RepID=A0ABS8JF68_9GAMM|nr:general secretion pathway protein GspB [Lysobacter lactosilyticus]MCC8362236.1 general secretion pathway protein GspB [Lysobacter lactosilyticus]